MIVKTSALFDGRGRVLHNQQITIEQGRITRVSTAKDKPAIDLTGLTVMPGWTDTHTHPTLVFQ